MHATRLPRLRQRQTADQRDVRAAKKRKRRRQAIILEGVKLDRKTWLLPRKARIALSMKGSTRK